MKLRYCLEKSLNETVLNAHRKEGVSEEMIQKIRNIHGIIKKTIQDGITNETIDYINNGVDQEIDRLRQIAYHSDQLLISYQQEICKKAQSNNIKIKYINNAGYVIEATPKDIEKIEHIKSSDNKKFDFLRKQTLKTGQRYVSSYLEDIQTEIITAKEQLIQKEQNILENLKDEISKNMETIIERSENIAYLDIVSSHAAFAQHKKLSRPSYTTKGTTKIKQ